MRTTLLGVVGLLLAGEARADDGWCRPDTVESQIRRWGTAPFGKKKQFKATADELKARLSRELLGTLAQQVDRKYEAEVLSLTSRVQTLTASQRKVKGGREACVVVQMDKGGIVGDLPSDIGRELLSTWHDRIDAFAAGRPVWVREVALRDRAEPEVDEIVIPRVTDLVRRNLFGVIRYEPDGGPIPTEIVTLDVRVTPFPGQYAVEGVIRDSTGRSVSMGAELSSAWIGEIGQRAPLSSRDVRIDRFFAPTSVFRGKELKIEWSSVNARRCALEPGVGEVPLSGKLELLPVGDSTYTLTCTDGVRTTKREISVVVKIPTAGVAVMASSEAVGPGVPTSLGWMGKAVSGCSIDQGIGAVGKSGQVSVAPTTTTTWTVTCQGDDGSVAVGSATVRVDNSLPGPPGVTAPPSTGPSPTPPTVVVHPNPDPTVRLQIRSLDGNWADVRVDGLVVAEFRNSTEATATIKPGDHVIEVVPFMAGAPSARVRLRTGEQQEVVIGVTTTAPIECYAETLCKWD